MKMLLVGDINETLYSLSEYLMKDFQTQICSNNADLVKDMMKVYKPTIVLFLVNEINNDVKNLLSAIAEKRNNLPLVVIGPKELREDIENAVLKFNNRRILYRPVVTSEVRRTCMTILNKAVEDEEETVEIPSKKKILVVDDNALMLRNVKKLLEKEYDVVLAKSGEKALSLLKNNPIDLILLDYNMPGMSGREVFENLLQDETTKDIPVVFLTSVAERDRIYAVLKNIPFGYILKPPANEKIISVIKDALG